MPLFKQLIILVVAIVIDYSTVAQKTIQKQFTVWTTSNNRISLSNKLTLQLDANMRSTHKLSHIQTILIWPGLIYHVSNQLNIAAGYCLLDSRQEIDVYSGYTRENQMWEQLIYTHALKLGSGLQQRAGNILHRLRYEQRFIPGTVLKNNTVKAQGSDFVTRFRYMLRGAIPLRATPVAFEKGAYVAMQDEVMLNISGQQHVNGKVLDQNRTYVATGYRFSKKVDIELGYMYRYIDDGDNTYIHDNVMQFTTFLRL
jgi:hypothetical protein